MRGADTFTESLLPLHHLEDLVLHDHPLRRFASWSTKGSDMAVSTKA